MPSQVSYGGTHQCSSCSGGHVPVLSDAECGNLHQATATFPTSALLQCCQSSLQVPVSKTLKAAAARNMASGSADAPASKAGKGRAPQGRKRKAAVVDDCDGDEEFTAEERDAVLAKYIPAYKIARINARFAADKEEAAAAAAVTQAERAELAPAAVGGPSMHNHGPDLEPKGAGPSQAAATLVQVSLEEV